MQALFHPTVRKIAVANPQHAPYGMAAMAALKTVDGFDRLKNKLVFGENVSQAADYVRKGAAEIGIVSYSLALAPPLQRLGRYWPIPAELYPALNQSAVRLRRSARIGQAKAFVRFLTEDKGKDVLASYGFLEGEH